MLEVLDLDEFLPPFCLCGLQGCGLRLVAARWGRAEQAVVPLPGSTLHMLLHGCCPFKTS